MQATVPIAIEKTGSGYHTTFHAFWGAEIPYLPEFSPSTQHAPDDSLRIMQQSWLRFVAAIAQLPAQKHLSFDLRFLFDATDDDMAIIRVALLGHASATTGGEQAAREQGYFAWRALNGLLPSEYPLQPLSKEEIQRWRWPYPDPRVLEIHKRLSLLGDLRSRPLPHQFQPTSTSLFQTCRALIERSQPCALSIAITPTTLRQDERQLLGTALYATRAEILGTQQVRSKLKLGLAQQETQDILDDLSDLGQMGAKNSSVLPTILLADPQLSAAIRTYSQLLSAPALLSVRVALASPSGFVLEEIGHAVGADLCGLDEQNHDLVFSGYTLIDEPKDDLHNRFQFAQVLPAEADRLTSLCTAYEATAAFRLPLPTMAWIGIPTRPKNPFRPMAAFSNGGPPPHALDRSQTIQLGRIVDNAHRYYNRQGQPMYKLHLGDLTQHVLLVGGTGSGKTTTGLHLMQQVRAIPDSQRSRIRVMLIDPVKTELRALLRHVVPGRNLIIFSAGSTFSPLYIDPFRVPDGVSPEQHIQMLVACFAAAFPMGGPLELLLTRSLRDVYCELYGAELSTPLAPDVVRPITPPNILRYIAHKASERIKTYVGELRGNLTAAVQHRLEWLAEGVVGRTIVPRPGDRVLDIDSLLTHDVLIELRLLPGNEEKALVMAFLLTLLGEHYAYSLAARGETPDTAGQLRHLTWIDEAQRLFAALPSGNGDPEVANARGRVIDVFVEMLSEMRSRGEGLVISTQLPSLLDARVRKHPGMKIMHRLTPEDDRAVLGATMDLNDEQLRFVTRLPAGEAVVFRGQFPAAMLVQVPDLRSQWAESIARQAGRARPLPEDWLQAAYVSDAEVAASMLNQAVGVHQPISPVKSLFEQAIQPAQAAQTPRQPCVFCRTTTAAQHCPFVDHVALLFANRDPEFHAKVWAALQNQQWDELSKAVSAMLRSACEPSMVYCAVARMAQVQTKHGEPWFKRNKGITKNLLAFAGDHNIPWTNNPDS